MNTVTSYIFTFATMIVFITLILYMFHKIITINLSVSTNSSESIDTGETISKAITSVTSESNSVINPIIKTPTVETPFVSRRNSRPVASLNSTSLNTTAESSKNSFSSTNSENATNISDANVWVSQHNRIRQDVNQKPIKWNALIAQEAQNYSAKCQFKHSDPSTRVFNGTQLGENLAMGAPYSSYTDEQIVGLWETEKQKYQYPNYPTQETGHYTQIVNKNVSEFGCGCSKCDNLSNVDGDVKQAKMCVCRYNPIQIGNQAPY